MEVVLEPCHPQNFNPTGHLASRTRFQILPGTTSVRLRAHAISLMDETNLHLTKAYNNLRTSTCRQIQHEMEMATNLGR